MAKHSINLGYCIQFLGTSVMAMKSRHMEHIIREVRETELHLHNMNRFCFSLSKSWKPFIAIPERMREGTPLQGKMTYSS
jgi:hypothetical protein